MKRKYCTFFIAACVCSMALLPGCHKKNIEDAVATSSNATSETSGTAIAGENYMSTKNPFTSVDIGNIGSIELIDYDNVDVTLSSWYSDATDDDVNSYIDNLLSSELVPVTDRASQKGDTITVDFHGTINGEEFDGNTGTDYEFKLGSGKMLSDFDSALYNVKAGDEVTAQVNLPSDYNIESIAGKTAEFKITVKSIMQSSTLNEEFIKDHSETGATTEAAFRKEVKDTLSTYYSRQNELNAIEKAIDEIAQESTIEPSEAFESYLYDYYQDNMTHWLSESNMTLDDYKSMTKMSDEDIDNNINALVDENIKSIMVLRQIAADHDLDDSDKDHKELQAYMKYFYNQEMSDEEIADIYSNQLDMMGLQSAVYNYMKDHVHIIYDAGESATEANGN